VSRPCPFADRRLAQRLERAEAHANRRFVEARARVSPESRACWTDVGGAYAMFDGVDSPLTQTFGLGMFEPVSAAQLEQLETFFAGRGAPTFHEVSPLADASAPGQLHARGYEPFEFTSVMYRPLRDEPEVQPGSPVHARLTHAAEVDAWARAAAEGWSEFAELQAFMLAFGGVIAAAEDGLTFVVDRGGRIEATAAMVVHDGIALLAGASTVPDARRQGAQAALLAARLAEASARGCDIAMMCAQPGSGSQRNAERNGFRIAYTRLKWRRPASGRPRPPGALSAAS
jgi:hypothetical protein